VSTFRAFKSPRDILKVSGHLQDLNIHIHSHPYPPSGGLSRYPFSGSTFRSPRDTGPFERPERGIHFRGISRSIGLGNPRYPPSIPPSEARWVILKVSTFKATRYPPPSEARWDILK
ncbi:hypothetical protein AMTR_s00057p00034830, partial [Amborella trichopoda]